MKKIIVFGGLNMDMSIESSRIPNAGESVVGRGFLATPGGKGGNQAVAAARMGADTFMVGKVGNDHNGRKITSELTNHGVSVMSVSLTARAATGVALIVRSQSEYFSIVDPGANQKMSYEEVRSAIHGLGQHKNIFLMSLGVDFEVAMQALACAKRNRLFTMLNASGRHELPDEAYQGLDLLIINRTDCAYLSGIQPVDDEACERALRFFADKGVKDTVILLKERGSATLVDGSYLRVPGYEVNVVDASCGGDTYVGELAARLSEGGSLAESMVYASAAAALSLTKVGAQESIPSWSEVQSFVEDHRTRA